MRELLRFVTSMRTRNRQTAEWLQSNPRGRAESDCLYLGGNGTAGSSSPIEKNLSDYEDRQ